VPELWTLGIIALMKPIRLLILASLLSWFCGLVCIGFALLRWHRGEVVAPDGAATVPILLYKDALAVIHVMTFHVVPAFGLGFLVAAALISVYLFKNWKHDKPDA
jgi:hypothetical protein